VLRTDDGGQPHDGRLQRGALVLRVVPEVAQKQVGHQLVPVDLAISICVYLRIGFNDIFYGYNDNRKYIRQASLSFRNHGRPQQFF
jgi:hypothetical protein